jgi:hypothetical protein
VSALKSRFARTAAMVALFFAVPASAQVQVRDLPKPSVEIDDPFSLVSGAIEIKPGQVLAIDGTEASLLLVDFAKGTRTAVGRQGSGPGEYRAPAALFRVRGDSIWVLDAMLQRITAFNPDLTPGTTFPMLMLDQSTMTVLTAPFFSDRTGKLYSSAMKIQAGMGGGGNDMQMTIPDSVGVVKFDPRQAFRQRNEVYDGISGAHRLRPVGRFSRWETRDHSRRAVPGGVHLS